ncbi:MAG: VanZ family protein [Bacillota bacterium]
MKMLIKAGAVTTLIVYLMILSKLILFKYMPVTEIIRHFTFQTEGTFWNQHNFIPFKTIIYYLFLADINLNIRIENLVGNIIGFAPLGFLLPLISIRFHNLKSVSLASLCLSLAFEVTQFVFKFGSFDVDDAILNTLGGILGYLPIKLFFHLKNKNEQSMNNKAVKYIS